MMQVVKVTILSAGHQPRKCGLEVWRPELRQIAHSQEVASKLTQEIAVK